MTSGNVLTIREVARRTGVSPATLRIWESRYGFPVPQRLPSGHRRYSEAECERVAKVVRDRDAGLSLPAAIARHSRAAPGGETSIYAGLRRRRADLAPYLLPKQTLVRMSHAIEDECAARAERPVLIATFQRERFYRQAEGRYRDLTRTAEIALVLADFSERRDPVGAPVEVPIPSAEPLGREWTLVCDAPGYSACLSAWERLGQDSVPDGDRLFETIWTVAPESVRTAVRIAAELLAETAPDLAERLEERLSARPSSDGEALGLVSAISSRMVAYVGNASAGDTLPPHR